MDLRPWSKNILPLPTLLTENEPAGKPGNTHVLLSINYQ